MRQDKFCDQLQIKLANHMPIIQNETDYLVSAVMVPLIRQTDGLSLLFEVRSAQLHWQPGEICFPGGRIEANDACPAAAALREVGEELGLARSDLRLLGPLDYVVSPIGVIMYPFVGYIAGAGDIKPNRAEVAEVFTVPLEYLLNHQPLSADMEVATRPLPGFPFQELPHYSPLWRRRATYPVLFYHYKDYVIWGITARVLYNFLETCRDM